ncbi:MAG TPA: cupredoxin domain-containing protein [Candidatus Acidoferrales bacterium]|nr:cupredoxin domain-containing protein [Candidatus Acidoferrales bacterium]
MFYRGWMGVMILAIGASLAANSIRIGPPQGETQVIEVSAKKFEFTPAEIRVKKGAHVQLKVTATDRDHGMLISTYAAGADKKGEPGLKFDGDLKKPEFKLPKDQPVTIEFTADKAGTYDFKCSVFCGMGHGGMKGQIVVEP